LSKHAKMSGINSKKKVRKGGKEGKKGGCGKKALKSGHFTPRKGGQCPGMRSELTGRKGLGGEKESAVRTLKRYLSFALKAKRSHSKKGREPR